MHDDWKKDPRIHSMNPEKIQFLSDFADHIKHVPKSQLLSEFLHMTMAAKERNITFSDQETELLASILVKEMNPADRGKLDMLRMLSKKLASRGG